MEAISFTQAQTSDPSSVFLDKLTDLSALSSLDNIQTLKIKYCGALLGLENLGDKNQLVELELDTLPIEDLNILTRFPSLEDLKLTDLEKLVSLPKNLADIKSLKSVYLNDLEELKDISVLEKCEGLAEFECKRSGPSRKAIAKVEASIANGKGESLELRTSYFAFMETMYQTLTGKEDKSHTYDFPLWFDTPETLLDAMEDFSWLDDYLDDDSELTAILTNPENGLRPLAILDWSFDGCNTDYIDAYSEEIFLVDTESPLNPVLLWGHDSEPREIHKSFDSFLANLRDFELPNEEGTSTTTYLEYVDEKSSKFWKIEIVGNKHIVTYGKIGSAGRTSEKDFDDAESTKKSADKLISSKRKKGYSEP